ncbi:MAG: phage tail tape measure protein [Hyphomicrobiales bacterium]|nr:phage tail tape measure protein [Hyphomicrobiales bacterium]
MMTLDSRIVISALDRASKVFGGIGGNADTLAGKLDRADRRISRFGLMAASSLGLSAIGVTGFVATSVKAYARWEDRLAAFGNVIGATGERLDAMGDKLRDNAAAVGQTQEGLLSAAELLAGRGLAGDVAVDIADDVGKAATAAGASIEDMSAAAFAAISNLKMAENEISKAFDIMAQGGKEGGFELKDMARWMPELTASMAELGTRGAEGLAEIAAASQVAMKNAGSPDQAANNLSNFFGKLKSADTTKRFRDKLGIDLSKVFQKSAKQGTSYFLDMLDLIQEKTKGDPFKIAALFPDKQAADGLRALLANREELNRILETVRKASGVIDADFQRRMDTLNGKMAQLAAKWEQLKLTGGEFIAPAAMKALDLAIAQLDRLPEAFEPTRREIERIALLIESFQKFTRTGAYANVDSSIMDAAEARARKRHGLHWFDDVSGVLQDEGRVSREGLTPSELETAKARRRWFEKQMNGRKINDDMIREQMQQEGLLPPEAEPNWIPIPRTNPRRKAHKRAEKRLGPPTQAELDAAQDEIWKWKFEEEQGRAGREPRVPPKVLRTPPQTFQGGHDTRDIRTLMRMMDIHDPDGLGTTFDGLPVLKTVRPGAQVVMPGKGDLAAGVRPGLAPPGPDIHAVLMDMKTLFENPEFAPGTLDSALAGKVEAELQGKADINVRVEVEGPGRVTGISADTQGPLNVRGGTSNRGTDNTGAPRLNRGMY